ncbi:MAG: transposase [Ardenticatenaceae bacterium]|nr:transposase [Ardenticatenaceae bacterium]HBY93731.1 transposase [Chloroflexota bacterium]
MRKTYKYRIYPTKPQERQLARVLEECRWLYNETLAYRKRAWEERQESVGLYDTQRLLPAWKKARPSLKQVHSQVLQNVQVRVDLAFKAFFRRVKAGETLGYPRFRGQGRYDSFTFPQFGFSLESDKRRHNLSKIGDVKIVLHRPVEGTIKTLTIRRTPTGKWFASFSVEVECEPSPDNPKVVGVDVGLECFATLSTGEQIANPRFFRRDEKALAKAQRKLSTAAKGTPERAKRRQVVARIHERIANRRNDFAHKLARRLVDEHGLVVFEDLNTNGMLQNHHLAKSISDAAWNQLVQYATFKAECAGRRVVLVNPRNTSKMCSRCEMLVEKSLSVRVHACPHCGLEMDRDHNAALNILRLGLQSLAKA